jgi:hypothetical protein
MITIKYQLKYTNCDMIAINRERHITVRMSVCLIGRLDSEVGKKNNSMLFLVNHPLSPQSRVERGLGGHYESARSSM